MLPLRFEVLDPRRDSLLMGATEEVEDCAETEEPVRRRVETGGTVEPGVMAVVGWGGTEEAMVWRSWLEVSGLMALRANQAFSTRARASRSSGEALVERARI